MSAEPQLNASTPSPADRVLIDAPCVNCGYNLRTLPENGLCPECAHPVWHSLRGYFLCYAPHTWIRTVARGLLLILIAVLAVLTVGPLVWVALAGRAVVSIVEAGGTPPTSFLRKLGLLQSAFYALPTALAIAGLWCFSRPDPIVVRREPRLASRRLIRIGCWLLPILLLADLIHTLVMPPFPSFGFPGPPNAAAALFTPGLRQFVAFGLVLWIGTLVTYTVLVLALMRHLAGLMRRVPRKGLVRFAQVEFWGLAASSAFLLVGYGWAVAALPAWQSAALVASRPAPSTTSLAVPAGQPSGSGVGGPAGASVPATSTPAGPTTGPPFMAASRPQPFPRLGRGFFTVVTLAGCGGALGGCGSAGFGLAALVLLTMACATLYGVAREAERYALLSRTPPNSPPAPPSDTMP